MLRRWVSAVTLLLCASGTLLYGQDEVFVRGKDKAIKGKIKDESPKEIRIGAKEVIPAADVLDVVYEFSKFTDTAAYRIAAKVEKDSLDPVNDAKRKALLADALDKYEKLAAVLTGEDKYAKRNLDYKIAMLRVRQAQEDGDAPEKAVAKLADFVKKNATGWQINSACQTLGRMQLDAGDFAAAEDTYGKLSKLDGLSEEAQLDARMLAIQAKIQGSKFQEAKNEVLELQKELPKGSRFQARARVAEAECLLAEAKKLSGKDDAGKVRLFEQAISLVNGVINESNDKYVKAVGHNTLGFCYLEQGKPDAAKWDFIWVDVEYNQDRLQHAKALYHLWDIFSKEGDAAHAQDCRERLLAPEFAGTEYQKKLQKEAKTP
jgi:tetratricopeptide (TPR) repeat protein